LIGLAETFGVRTLVSWKPFAGAACDLGFDAPAFGVVDGTLVELDFDEEEEFCEVGSGPAFDGRSQSFWNHEKSFTF
jgi:hypothetical protein